jgi:hypothetical protein
MTDDAPAVTEETPPSCSLSVGRLQERLAAISEIGVRSLVSREAKDGDHLLRFRADKTTRRQLEDIVAAEVECCSFLDLTLWEEGDEILLAIAAPGGEDAVADGLADAFAQRQTNGGRVSKRRRTGALLSAGGVALAACCIVAPAIFGLAIGATLGGILDIGAAVLVGIGVALVLHRRRVAKGNRC